MSWLDDDLQFDSRGLVPVIMQRAADGRVLTLAYANAEALERTARTGWAHFFSRSRGQLWMKGETSGNRQRVTEMRADCDADAVLYMVESEGPACHTGKDSCFFRTLWSGGAGPEIWDLSILPELQRVIRTRRGADPQESYVARLLGGESARVRRKIGEEATEVILADDGDALVEEVADLLFHALVLLEYSGRHMGDVLAALRRRRG